MSVHPIKFIALTLGLCLMFWTPQAHTKIDPAYTAGQTAALKISQRGQQQLGYAGGNIISDIESATLLSPFAEVGIRIRLLARYGSLLANSFASSTVPTDNNFSFGGYDRPMIRARQLVYGNFDYGRWYILDLGLSMFNATGYVSEFFRYWSARVGLHESVSSKILEPQIEMGLTVRSLTEFSQPSNIGLIYPPSIDVQLGVRKKLFNKLIFNTDLKLEQSLAETKIAGSYDSSKALPLGAPTYLIFSASTAWKLDHSNEVSLSISDRLFRWPDNSSSALWDFFEEGYYGRSFTVSWKGEW